MKGGRGGGGAKKKNVYFSDENSNYCKWLQQGRPQNCKQNRNMGELHNQHPAGQMMSPE